MHSRINSIIEKLNDVSQIDQFEKVKESIIADLQLMQNNLTCFDLNENNITTKHNVIDDDLTSKGYYLNAIIDNLPGLLWLKDADSKFLIVNKEYAKKYGYENPNDLIGKTDFDIKNSEIAIEYRNAELEIMQNGKVVISEESFVDGNNEKKWRKTYKAPVFDNSGNAIGTTGYTRDITNRKNAEWEITKLSQAVKQSSASIVITDLEGNIEYVNPKFTQITGYSYEEVIGKNSRILKSDKLDSEDYKVLWKTITSGSEWHGEFRNIKKNGDLFWELATISPIRDTEGEISNFLAVKEDITERKRIEFEIKESEEKFRQITENIGEVFWLRNAENTKMLYLNPAFENVWGRSCESIYNQPDLFEKSIFEEDKSKFAAKFREYAETESLNTEFRIVRPNGELRWIQVKSSPIKNKKNEIIRHTGIAIDITDLKNTEETLHKNKEKYRLLTENSSDVIWVYNLNLNKYSYISPAISELRGLTVKEALSEKITESFTPESLKVINKLINQNVIDFFETQKNTIHSIDEVQQIHKNGKKVWVEISSRLRYNELGESELVGVSRNIEKRKKIEEDLIDMTNIQNIILKMASKYINLKYPEIELSINQSLCDLCKFIDADRGIIYEYDWDNQICKNIYEWRNDTIQQNISELQNTPINLYTEQISAHKLGNIFIIQDISLFDGKLKTALTNQGVKSVISIPIMNQEQCTGFIKFESIHNNHVYSPEEKSLLFVFGQMLSNLQQRISLETRLVNEKENAQKSNQAKSEFLANMSHELRTPLNGVIGFSELLVKTPLSEMQTQYAQAINVSAKTLFGVINDILDFSKIEANKLELETIKVDIIHLLESSMEIIKHSAEKKGLEILLNISNDLPRYANVDPLRLTQVIANLLGNAVKFTSIGEVELKVYFEQKQQNQGVLHFSVRDTGIGISESQKAGLFKAFSQVDSSTTRKYGGTGLGLVISDMIISKMGSHINLDSKIDEGSTFYFSIKTEIEHENITPVHFDKKVPQCLIIDDNPNSCKIIKTKLSSWSIESIISNSSIEALGLINTKNDFDLIIIDNSMPLVNGMDTITLISRKTACPIHELPLILLHASTENAEFYAKSDSLEIPNRLTKPLKISELKDCLLKILIKKNVEKIITESHTYTQNQENLTINYKHMKILIADDDMFNMILAKAMIKNILPNAELIEARNGKEAVEKTFEYSPDLIFMDVQMPEMDGNDATKMIRSREINKSTKIPIIGLTAGALKEEKEKCFLSGMDDFLTKPIDSTKLEATINNYLVEMV